MAGRIGDHQVPAYVGEEGVDPRTGRKINPDYANWTTHPNNPMALKAEIGRAHV